MRQPIQCSNKSMLLCCWPPAPNQTDFSKWINDQMGKNFLLLLSCGNFVKLTQSYYFPTQQMGVNYGKRPLFSANGTKTIWAVHWSGNVNPLKPNNSTFKVTRWKTNHQKPSLPFCVVSNCVSLKILLSIGLTKLSWHKLYNLQPRERGRVWGPLSKV